MDRRLILAYDEMTMPEACSRRIEDALTEKQIQQRGRYQRVLNTGADVRAWIRGAALVCLMIALGFGSTMLFLRNQMGTPAAPSELPGFTDPHIQTTAAEDWEDVLRVDHFPYGQQGEDLLEKMCHLMPPWDGYASLDDVFWTEFVVRLLSDYTWPVSTENLQGLYGSRVTTLAGDAMLLDDTVHISRENLNRFVQNLMGCELPEFTPRGEYLDRISCRNGSYMVQVTQFPRGHYRRQLWGVPSSQEVTYDILEGAEQTVLGQVRFAIEEADNAWGFIILGRPTTMRCDRIQNPDMEAVAKAFGEAYFAGDLEALRPWISSRADNSLVLNPLVQNAYNNGEDSTRDWQIRQVRIYTSAGIAQAKVFVDYVTDPDLKYSQWSLILEMVQEEAGWRVRFWTEGNPYSFDPEQEEIFRTADSFLWNYFHGHSGWNKEHTTGNWDPPVYEGEGEPKVVDVVLYYDPLEADDTGSPMAQVWVEYQPEKSINPGALYLDFLKTENGWKVCRITEG